MSHVYKKVEIVGSSLEGVDDAINQAIAIARETIEHLEWYEVAEIRGWIKDGDPQHTQVSLKVGFRIDRG